MTNLTMVNIETCHYNVNMNSRELEMGREEKERRRETETGSLVEALAALDVHPQERDSANAL